MKARGLPGFFRAPSPRQDTSDEARWRSALPSTPRTATQALRTQPSSSDFLKPGGERKCKRLYAPEKKQGTPAKGKTRSMIHQPGSMFLGDAFSLPRTRDSQPSKEPNISVVWNTLLVLQKQSRGSQEARQYRQQALPPEHLPKVPSRAPDMPAKPTSGRNPRRSLGDDLIRESLVDMQKAGRRASNSKQKSEVVPSEMNSRELNMPMPQRDPSSPNNQKTATVQAVPNTAEGNVSEDSHTTHVKHSLKEWKAQVRRKSHDSHEAAAEKLDSQVKSDPAQPVQPTNQPANQPTTQPEAEPSAPHAAIFDNRENRNALDWIEKKGKEEKLWLETHPDAVVTFSPNEVALLKKYFFMRDVDGSGTLNMHELLAVVDDIGRKPKPNTAQAAVLDALVQQADVNGDKDLEFNEFLLFLSAYYDKIYMKTFSNYDRDDSGTIELKELKPLLHAFTKSGFEVDWNRVEELISYVDTDSDGTLDYNEFCHLMSGYRRIEFDHLQECAGFEGSKVRGMRDLFKSMDHDHSGTLNAREVASLLDRTALGRSLNTRADLHAFSALFARMDRDNSSSLDFEEFLRLLRVWRGGGHVTESSDNDGVLSEPFGSAKESIIDGWAEEFEHDMEDAFLAKQFGLIVEEVRTIRDCFALCNKEGSASLQREHLEAMVWKIQSDRKEKTLQQMEALKSAIGSDREEWEFKDAVAVVCKYYDALASTVLAPRHGEITSSQLLSALYAVGEFVAPKALEKLLSQVGLSYTESVVVSGSAFREILKCIRSQHMSAWRETCSFEAADIELFQAAYEKSLKTQKESCEGKQSQALQEELKFDCIRDVLRDLGYGVDSPEQRADFFRSASLADRDNSGGVSFQEFLLLMRYLKNRESLKTNKDNVKAIEEQMYKKGGLDKQQGLALMQLFYEHDEDRDGKLQESEVLHIMAKVLKIGLGRFQMIRDAISSANSVESDSATSNLGSIRPASPTSPKSGGPKVQKVAFPQFLEVIRIIMEHDKKAAEKKPSK